MNNYLLSLLIFSPLLGMIILAFVPKDRAGTIKLLGILATLLPLVLALLVYAGFDSAKDGYQMTQHAEWIHINYPSAAQEGAPPLTIMYAVGVDGLSLPLLLLTAIISTLAAVASIYIKKRWKSYFMWFLLLEIGMLGVFLAQDLFLFFVFFELTLIPMFFLIGIWGYEDREKAANKFLIYNGVGSAIMLIAIITLAVKSGFTTFHISIINEYLNMPGSPFTSMNDPQYGAQYYVSQPVRYGLLIAFLVAFGIKLPIFPFHSWMLKVHVQAPPAIVMIHSGILLKMGAYGLLRIGVNIFPQQVKYLAALLAVLGLINIIYGAVLAFVQTDLKKVLAYSSVSHMGIVLLGIAALNEAGIQGAIFQAVSHGLISALLFFIVGVIYERTGTSEIEDMSGLARSMPFISGIFLAAGMASLGLPGMSGFISEFNVFLGLFKTFPVFAAIGTIGIILTAAYVLRAIMNTTFGPTNGRSTGLSDANVIEAIPMIVLLGIIILIGVYPSVLADTLQGTVQSIVSRIGG